MPARRGDPRFIGLVAPGHPLAALLQEALNLGVIYVFPATRASAEFLSQIGHQEHGVVGAWA